MKDQANQGQIFPDPSFETARKASTFAEQISGRRTQSLQPFILWLEWKHYYTDHSNSRPQVVMRDHVVFDMNVAAHLAKIGYGMRKHQVLPLVPECLITKWQPDPKSAERWLDLCLPFSGQIEPIEEHVAALDLSDHPDPLDIARKVTERLATEPFGLLIYGAGPSKWLAQLAASERLPLHVMHHPASFLAPLSVQKLTPVEVAHRTRLKLLGYRTIGSVARLSEEVLQSQFGPASITIAQAAKGGVSDRVVALYPHGSLSEPFHFDGAVTDEQVVLAALDLVSERLAKRMNGRQAGTLSLKIELENGLKLAQSRCFKRPVHDHTGIRASLRILWSLIPAQESGHVRFTAELADLEPLRLQQKGFFVAQEKKISDVSLRAIQSAYGTNAIVKASSIRPPRRVQVLKEWRNATGWN